MIRCPECKDIFNITVRCHFCNAIFEIDKKPPILTFKEFQKNLLIIDFIEKEIKLNYLNETKKIIEIENEIKKIEEYFKSKYKDYNIAAKKIDNFLSLIENIRYESTFYYLEYYDCNIFFESRNRDKDKQRIIEILYYEYLEKFAWEKE